MDNQHIYIDNPVLWRVNAAKQHDKFEYNSVELHSFKQQYSLGKQCDSQTYVYDRVVWCCFEIVQQCKL